MKRFLFDVLLFLSVFLLPWWLTVVLTLIGVFIFKNFYEFLIISAIVFAIYRAPSERVIASPLWYPLIIGVVYIGIQFLKSNIILYKNEI